MAAHSPARAALLMSSLKNHREQLALDIYRNRRITTSMYCGSCGYNLKTLPYVHACPECGAEYNARFPGAEGVFLLDDVQFPLGDVVANLALIAFTVFCVWAEFNAANHEWLLLAVLFGSLSIVYCFIAARMLRRYVRYFFIARRVARVERQERLDR